MQLKLVMFQRILSTLNQNIRGFSNYAHCEIAKFVKYDAIVILENTQR